MKIGFLIDPLQTLKPYKESTVALMQSAQKLGHDCFYFTQKDIFCTNGEAFAQISSIKILDEKSPDWANTLEVGDRSLKFFDIILMRKDPPFNLEYIYTTYALELAEKQGVLIANKPQSLRDANEKCFLLNFPQCSPVTMVSKSFIKLTEFWELHRKVVFKPLDGMGGKSIFFVDESGQNLSVILDTLTQNESISIMAQVYIPEISTMGDKRILVINGEPFIYALARIPKEGEFRGNLAAGGQGKIVEITDRDKWICEQLKPILKEKGIYFAGLDVIGNYLTEINVTSPTCIREISNETGKDIADEYITFLESIR